MVLLSSKKLCLSAKKLCLSAKKKILQTLAAIPTPVFQHVTSNIAN